MKKIIILILIIVYTTSFTAVLLTGCNGNMDQMGNEPELSVDYLSGGYATQLIRDGASVIFGAVDIEEDEEGAILVTVGEREFVESPGRPNGFYIADKNLESIYQISSDARATYLSGSSSIAKVIGFDEFIAANHTDKLYDIYIMGDQIELLIARYIP